MCLNAYSSSPATLETRLARTKSWRSSVPRAAVGSTETSPLSAPRCATAPAQNTEPTIDASCATSLSRRSRRSSRELIRPWRLVGTGSVPRSLASFHRPESSMPWSLSIRTVSSRKRGFPPAFAISASANSLDASSASPIKSARSSVPAASGSTSSSARREPGPFGTHGWSRGARDAPSTRRAGVLLRAASRGIRRVR